MFKSDYPDYFLTNKKGVHNMRLRRLQNLHMQAKLKLKLNTHYAPVVELEDTSDLSSDASA